EPREAEPGSLLRHAQPTLRPRVPAPPRLAGARRPPERHLPPPPWRHADRLGGGVPPGGPLEASARRPLRLGDAAVVHRHRGPAGPGGADPRRRVRDREGGVPRRARGQLDAAELLGDAGGGRQRGRPPPRRGRAGDGRAPRAPVARRVSRVAVLKGGRSLEREVSLRSGANVEAALRRLGHDVVALDADRNLVRTLRAEKPDVAFVAMHGEGGEDGTVQELLEIIGIPYTGSGVTASERSWDKVVAKASFAGEGLPTP